MMDLITRGNDALKVNSIIGVDEALSVHGSDWLWATTAIFSLALVRFLKFPVSPHLNVLTQRPLTDWLPMYVFRSEGQ